MGLANSYIKMLKCGDPVPVASCVATDVNLESVPRSANPKLIAYPNPTQAQATIEFTLDRPQQVDIRVFDVLGREVSTVTKRDLSPGRHTATFRLDPQPSGVYLVRLSAGNSSRVIALTLKR